MDKCRRVGICLVIDEQDRLLMGQRDDNSKWTCPGGHIEAGEDPYEGACRELKEETGLDAKSIKMVKAGLTEDKNGEKILLYLFKIEINKDQEVDTSGDPDNECPFFVYVDPFNHLDDLHVPVEKNWAIKYWATGE